MWVYHYILKTEQFKDTLLHEASLSVSKIKLVGGEKEWEGNIIVGGKPVCDDGAKKFGEAVAKVVCRFILLWPKTNIWGDLLRSVPFIMWGHLNIEFFQTSAALIFTRNPKSTCLMMIYGHSGQAPKPFLYLFTHYEMSPHDNNKIRIAILIYFFL